MGNKLTLYSPHKPIPLARILEDEMDRNWTRQEKSNGRVMGQGTERRMKLLIKQQHKKVRPTTVFKAKMNAHDEGTLITGQFRIPGGVYWISFAALFIFFGSADSLSYHGLSQLLSLSALPAAAPSLLMLGFVGWYVTKAIGTRNADQQMMLDFLAYTIEANTLSGHTTSAHLSNQS